ncbi:polysaccharide pyruvyl transferase family protein [Acinetobacter sp. ANC 3832]|uniref:polysaccharide pyruvyl transferase family protein n=1 Tax=Acinetobacter sp. ANC 3832 TaxID=1977874 RepID=UPI000A3578A1|nr:polysaccharide pyruvyl transferase family protein [Acinetobacter sp. ANC 3832]OTG96171.1 hypothetical protein B9T35_00400 [Acinetobacter sp. ANC 3832]
MSFFFKEPPKCITYQLDNNGQFVEKQPIYTYWWDEIPNFGDWIGPYLLAKITDRPIINVKGASKEHAIFSVGSIIEHIDQEFPQAKIWGSGLIKAPHRKRCRKINRFVGEVHAVRGLKTFQELKNLTDLDIPQIFGDPALLLPYFYKPQKTLRTPKVSLCPHFSHFDYFTSLDSSEKIDLIKVGDPLLNVIDQIVNSDICISTSLHGLIVAQAYGVPWVWLTVAENKLEGDNFKFEDFFSTLHEQQEIANYHLELAEITEENVLKISSLARRSDYKYSLNALLDSCPIVRDRV